MKLKFENFKKQFDDFCLKTFFYLKANKRKFFAVSIFVALLLISIIPANESKAASPWLLAFGPSGLAAYITSWFWEMKDATMSEIIASAADNVLSVTIYPLVYFICVILLHLFGVGVTFAAWLVDVFIDPAVYSRVFGSSAIQIGWETVRDMSNTFFIMILLLIAFATILRIQTYSAKNLLPKFIIAIFLINFSAEITKIVIDIGQIFMFEIRSWMGTFGGSTGLGGSAGTLTSIVGHFRDIYLNWGIFPEDLNFGHENTIGIIFAVIFTAVLMFVYLLLAIFLLFRLVYLAVMIILSPLAFLGIVLPGLNKYTGDFWSKLFSNSISGFVLLFFVYLATQMANDLTTFDPTKTTPATGDSLNIVQSSIAYVVPYSVSIVMLLFSVSAAQKLGAVGASSIVGGIGGIGKIAIGTWGGMKLAGGFGKAVGAPIARRTGATDWARQKYEGVKDRVKRSPIARDTGVAKWLYKGDYNTFKKNRGEVEEKKNYYKRASTKGRYDEMLDGAWKGKSNNDIAAVVESMIEKKELTRDKIKETFTDEDGNVDEGKVKNLTDNIDEALLRAKLSFDVPKLRESMPRYAAMIELGKTGKESDDDKKAVDKKTEEYMKENTSEGKLSQLDRSAKEDPVVMNTIREDHDDFSHWVQGQSTTDQKSIYRGLEGILLDADKKIRNEGLGDGIHNMTGSDRDIKEAIGIEREEIDKIRRTMARNNKNGHIFLNDPARDGNGDMIMDKEGRIDFENGNANETMRKNFVDSVMKDKNDYKGRSDKFYENLAPYFRQKQFANVGKWESVAHQKIAKEAYFQAHPEQYDPESEHGKIVEYLNEDTAYGSIKTEAPSPVRNEKLVEDREHKKNVEEIESKFSDKKEKKKKLKKESERHSAELDKQLKNNRADREDVSLRRGKYENITNEEQNEILEKRDVEANEIEAELVRIKAKPERAESAETEPGTKPQKTESAGAEESEEREGSREIVEKLNEINNEIKAGFESLKSANPERRKDVVEGFIGRLNNLTENEYATSDDKNFREIIATSTKVLNEGLDEEDKEGRTANQEAGEGLVGINRDLNEFNMETGLTSDEKKKKIDELKEVFDDLTEEYIGIFEKLPGFEGIKEFLKNSSKSIDSEIEQQKVQQEREKEDEQWLDDDEHNQ